MYTITTITTGYSVQENVSDWLRLLADVTNNAHYHVSTPALELSGLLVVQMRACIGGDGAT